TLDRVGEGAVFAGLIFYFLTGPLPADMKPRALAAGLVALVASLLVSYTRARAEAHGVENKVGIAQRAERILLLGVPALVLAARPRAADRLAQPDGDDQARQAHRQTRAENQGLRSARGLEGPRVRRVGPDPRRRLHRRGESGRARPARAPRGDQGFPARHQAD